MEPDKDKLKKLETVVAQLNKTYGAGTVMFMKDKPLDVPLVKTGWLPLDEALGGGVMRGRIIEIFGHESAGKTSLALSIIKQVQDLGGVCGYIDAEHAFDVKYAGDLGINLDGIFLSQPDNGEQGLEIADQLISSGNVDIIVIDSVAALIPKAELEGEMGASKMGLHARLMSQACRKLTGKVEKTGTIVIFINQIREKIGVMFGNPETTTGGNALKYYATQRIQLSKVTSLKDKEGQFIGNTIRAKVLKNKIAPPFRTCEVDFYFGMGVDTIQEIFKEAVLKGIVVKSGSWFSYEGEKLGQGLEKALQIVKDNPEMYEEIVEKLKQI